MHVIAGFIVSYFSDTLRFRICICPLHSVLVLPKVHSAKVCSSPVHWGLLNPSSSSGEEVSFATAPTLNGLETCNACAPIV